MSYKRCVGLFLCRKLFQITYYTASYSSKYRLKCWNNTQLVSSKVDNGGVDTIIPKSAKLKTEKQLRIGFTITKNGLKTLRISSPNG